MDVGLFQADLRGKINKGISSKNYQNEQCNCQQRTSNGCDYSNICRDKCIVCGVKCITSKKCYIGATQDNFKTRMRTHMNEVRRLLSRGDRKDSFALHFGRIFQNFHNPSNKIQLSLMTLHKTHQGNPIACVPSFGSPKCHLCNQEKIAMFNLYRKNPNQMINHKSEITSKCKHKPQFHRFTVS